MRKTNGKSILWIVVVALLVLAGCDRNVVFDRYVTIPDEGWNTDSMAIFKVDIDNAEQAYNLVLNIRNRSNYPNSNLWLFIDIISPSGNTMQDKVDCTLADDNGKWIGSGWGNLYHVKVPYRREVKFAETGRYTFRVVQGMREEDLKGIYNIGLRLEKAEIQTKQ